ncbi:MAG: single-stranded DNA-binding protein [Solirubrobacteraceae bacterium]
MSYSDINKVVLVGRLTRDPELRALPSGRSACSLRIACNGLRKDDDGGYEQRPNFFDVSVFGVQAENVDRYMRKGGRVAIDGRLHWREWETPENERRQAVEVHADAIEFLDGGSAADGEVSELGSAPESELVGAGSEIPF